MRSIRILALMGVFILPFDLLKSNGLKKSYTRYNLNLSLSLSLSLYIYIYIYKQGWSCSLTSAPPIFFLIIICIYIFWILLTFRSKIITLDPPPSPQKFTNWPLEPNQKKSPSLYWKFLNWWKILYLSFVSNIYLKWATNFSR